MVQEIDIEKSKEKRKVVYSRFSFWKNFDVLSFLFALFFIFIWSSEIYKGIKYHHVESLSILMLLLSLLLSGFIIYSTIFMLGLSRISGISNVQNRHLVKQTARHLGWEVKHDSAAYTVFYRHNTFGSWDYGKEITVIYDAHIMLVNVISYGRYGTKSPFHYFGNKWFLNRFLKQLKAVGSGQPA
ncbi:hypothetical protein AM493_00725 [Flavobacterium akiainvivens]|uniref:Uncharacterized protein n=1 Tax=Flavobacterium akiainvivens TaxID=1202724 RepID=A0A0M9VGZ2_9FLAO|nr:hypothetical protein [Flavobacterium akiainvivens]KOS04732.1 hypothetical protein AM493_00725 [Flavobacterium akiainvivens]SFQ66926.1 hypothetical protein SAMN05444144_11377 [Flavobacterium akiainvivens]